MLRDGQGLELAAERPETVAAVDNFVNQALSYGKDYAPILAAAEAEPDSVMAGSLAAGLMMWLESGQSPALARPHLERCRPALARSTERERLWHAAAEAWVEGEMERALALLEEVTGRWPRDVFAMKLAQYHYFNLGRLDEMLAVCEKVLPANAENGYIHGCRAFGLEQTDRLQEAEAAGRKAVEMRRADPWAHHAVAHVMETQGRVAEGIAWMEGHADTWVDCNSFMLGHNWWHTALYHLERGDAARVLAIYDDHVWGLDKDYSQDQANAASLLWRLELRGLDVGGRWADVAAHVEGRTDEHVQPFLDLHYLMALARGGRDDRVAALVEGMAAHAAAAPDFLRPTLAEVALPAARGLAAYAAGDWSRAADELGRAVPRLQEIGGSHAQRDLFVQTWLEALQRAGRHGEALAPLRRRAEAKPSTPFGFRLLARSQAALGDAAAARDSGTRAAAAEAALAGA